MFKDGSPGLGEGRKWFEGFATYCADNFFADFYPYGTKTDFNLSKVYTEGKKKVEKAIDNYGEKILLEVPRRWKEFSNSVN